MPIHSFSAHAYYSFAIGEVSMIQPHLLHRPTVIPRRPRHNLHTPVVNLIAERLHGKDGEGFLELGADLLNPKEHRRYDGRGGDQGKVIPRRGEGIVKTEREEDEPDGRKRARWRE